MSFDIITINKLNKVSSKRGGVGESSTIVTFAENYLSLESSKLLIEKVINSDKRYIFSVSGDPFDKTYQSRNINDFYISLLRLDQIAWAFAKQHRKLLVADSRTEIDWAIKQKRAHLHLQWACLQVYVLLVTTDLVMGLEKYMKSDLVFQKT